MRGEKGWRGDGEEGRIGKTESSVVILVIFFFLFHFLRRLSTEERFKFLCSSAFDLDELLRGSRYIWLSIRC